MSSTFTVGGATIEVEAYVHQPLDGSAPYLVIEIDSPAGVIPVKVYRNDGLAYQED